jgi:hypothetical protein
MMFRLAFRNISRNRRRSLMTAALVAMGALALLLFGGFVTNIFAALETGDRERSGQCELWRTAVGFRQHSGGGESAAAGVAIFLTRVVVVGRACAERIRSTSS